MAGASDEVRIRVITETQQAVKDIAVWAASITAAIATVKKLADAISDMMEASYEQERAEAKLGATLKATGGAIGYTKDQLAELAAEMQRTTVFGDEAVMEAEALMLTYGNIGKETFPRVLKAAADLSTVLGQDLKSSVTQLGVALEDPAEGMTRLRRAGIVFTDEQKEMVKQLQASGDVLGAQNIILQALEQRVGGAAKMMGDTAWGATVKFKGAIADLKQTLGSNFAQWMQPVITATTDFVLQLNEVLQARRAIAFAGSTVGTNLEESIAEKKAELTLLTNALKQTDSPTIWQKMRATWANIFGGNAFNFSNREQAIRRQYQLSLELAEMEKTRAEILKEQSEQEKAKTTVLITQTEELKKQGDARSYLAEAMRADREDMRQYVEDTRDARQNMADYLRADREYVVETRDARENLADALRAEREYTEDIRDARQNLADFLRADREHVEAIAESTESIRDDVGTVLPSVAKLESSSDLLARDFEELQTGISAAAKMLKGDFTAAMQSALSLAGPQGALVGSIIGFAQDIVDTMNAALSGKTEFATGLAAGLSSLFANAMADSDWTDFRKAMSEKVRAAVAEAIAQSALLAPYIDNFTKRLQRYLSNPSDRNYRLLQDAYMALMNAGENAADIYEGIIGSLPGAGTQVAGTPIATTPATITAMPSSAKSVVVNFNGPTFGDEPTMRRYVVSAVQEAVGGY